MSTLWFDVRYALRMMAKAPGLTAVLVITLALGIGASTTIFSVVHSVVLQPLPYAQPERLVRIYTELDGAQGLTRLNVSPPEYDDLRRACRSCESIGAWSLGTAVLSGGERPTRVIGAYTTHTLLPMLGVRPQLGRWFDPSEQRPGVPMAIVLGDGVWRRAFGADPNVIGRKIYSDAVPVTVIGVMPPGFDFPERAEAWLPHGYDFAAQPRDTHGFRVLARLAPDATLGGLQAELGALAARWSEHTTSVDHRIDPVAHPMIAAPLHADLVGSIATALWLLQAAVLGVLLIAIVNIASILLARAEARMREVAVRHALGASRRRLVRQFVTESLLLGAVGGALGILAAGWGVDGVVALIPRTAPRVDEIGLDGTAVAFAVACSVGAALLFGLAPILHARHRDLYSALKDGASRMTGTAARLRARRALVVTELALAVVLVVSCTVMVRSFARLQQAELGFAPDHLLVFEVEIPEQKYPGVTGDLFWRQLEDRLRTVPGATSATLLGWKPVPRNTFMSEFEIVGRAPSRAYSVEFWQYIGADALPTLGGQLVRGRALLPSDDADAPDVVLINEAFAAKFFAGVDPVGQRLRVRPHTGREQTIVGIVADMKQAGVDQPAGTEVFMPVRQAARSRSPAISPVIMWGVLRAAGDPMALAPAVQRIVTDLDPAVPISNLRTMDDVLWEAVARPRFLMFLLAGFAGLALLLAAVGIYGVMAHTVAQRTHEIGLRVALGAQPGQVRSMVLRQAGGLVAAGVGIGLAVAIALQLALDAKLTGLFYGDALTQPLLLAGVAAVVALTALLATWIPVRRATRIEPMTALRSE